MLENKNFSILSEDEMLLTDGGFALTTALIVGGVICGVSFVGGVAVSAYNSYKDCEREYGK